MMLTKKLLALVVVVLMLGACGSSTSDQNPAPVDSTPSGESPSNPAPDVDTDGSNPGSNDDPTPDDVDPVPGDNDPVPGADDPSTEPSVPGTDFSLLVGIWDASEVTPKAFTVYIRISEDGSLDIIDYQGDASNGAGTQNCYEISNFKLTPIANEIDLYLQKFQGPLSSGFSGDSIRYLKVNDNTLVVAEPRHEGDNLGEPSELIKDPDGNVQLVNIQVHPRLTGIDPEFNECV